MGNLGEQQLTTKSACRTSPPHTGSQRIGRARDTARQAGETLSSWGVAAMGANCGTGPEEVEKVLEQMKEASPQAILMAKPNAGVPRLIEGRTEYNATPALMAEYAQRFVQLGVTIIGACCGSTPEHLAAMARALGKASAL